MRYSKADKAESLAQLRKVSRSGMMRRISLGVVKAGEFRDITWDAARVLGYPIRSRGGWVQDRGLSVSGCGMDMGYHLVNSLSYALHGMKSKGDGAKEENQGRPYNPRRGHYRAGYSLNHRWM